MEKEFDTLVDTEDFILSEKLSYSKKGLITDITFEDCLELENELTFYDKI